jgi:hypothetical protein
VRRVVRLVVDVCLGDVEQLAQRGIVGEATTAVKVGDQRAASKVPSPQMTQLR